MTNKETQPKIESVEMVPQSKGTPSAKEIVGSLELAVDFLEKTPDSERYSAVNELVIEFLKFSQKEIDTLANEQEALYIDLIKRGMDGYLELRAQIMEDEEMSKDEKQKKTQGLERSFKSANELRQVVRVQALDSLLANFTNPYNWTTDEKYPNQEIIYSPMWETATNIVDYETGKYKSDWNPEVHFHKHLGKFLSESDANEIRKFIEGFFEQNFKVDSLSEKVRTKFDRKINTGSYDPEAAEVILSELGKLPAGLKLGKYTRVVVGASSISIILSDSDYVSCRGDQENLRHSGGVHYGGTVLNLVKGEWLSQDTIRHENEHALNDILLGIHQADMKEEAMGLVASFELHKEYNKQELENIFKQVVHSMFETNFGGRFFMTRFADEVLAYKLGDNSSNERVLDTLNHDKLYYYLNVTDENINAQYGDISSQIDNCLTDVSNILIKSGKQQNSSSRQVAEFLNSKDLDDIRPLIRIILNKDSVYKMREMVVEQVDRLIKARVKPEKIRALLSPNNPLKWRDIADRELAHRDILAEDRVVIRNSFRTKAEKAIGNAKKIASRSSEFQRFVEMPDEEKNSFESANSVVNQLVIDNFKIIKDGFNQGDGYKTYKCSLRKKQGENIYNIIINQDFEYDPTGESQEQAITTNVQIKVGNSNNIVQEKSLSFGYDDKSFTFEYIKLAIAEAEQKAGIKVV